MVGVATEMQDLQGDLAALGVDGGGDEAVVVGLLLGGQLGPQGMGRPRSFGEMPPVTIRPTSPRARSA